MPHLRLARTLTLATLLMAPLAAHAQDIGGSVVTGPLPDVDGRFGAVAAPPAAPPAAVAVSEGTRPADYSAAWRRYLAAERRLQISRLHTYRLQGVFPRNDSQPGMLNIFVDASGVHCAMANLIARSGHETLALDTARSDNATRLGEVHDGALMDWMLTSGLTQEEAAFVQEPDDYIPQNLQRDIEASRLETERQRLQTHFAQAEQRLRRDTRLSLAVAFARLGDRVHSPPPPVR